MNYYEELGVSPSASIGEIRQAYKALARLLHPDQCADEKLRGLAELQMKRLNQMLAVLADPAERRRYDAALALGVEVSSRPYEEPREPVWKRWSGAARAAWPWAATAAVVVAALVYSFTHTGPQDAPPASPELAWEAKTEPAATPPSQPADRSPRPKAKPRPAPAPELDDWAREMEALRARQRALAQKARAAQRVSALPPPAPAEAPPATPPEPVEVSKAPAPAPRREPANLFAGNWFYVPGMTQPKTNGLYPPIYIELRLSEEGGVVKGRYRARYRVTDQAISPAVAFQFEGPGAAPSARLPWRDPGGAEGQIALRLISESALEVNWTAHRLSDDLHLTSGTAVLVRQQER